MAQKLSSGAEQALRHFEDNQGWHRQFIDRVNRRHKAFEGILEMNTDAARWRSKLHPPYANHIVETTLSGLVDDRLKFQVKPAPRFYNPGEYEQVREGARAHEILFRYQLHADQFNTKLRPFALQAAIAEFSVMKTLWRRDRQTKKKLDLVPDENGGYELKPVETQSVAYDGPCSEVVDVRDFGFHEAATDIQKALYCWHRVWVPIEELKQGEKNGIYQNVSLLEGNRVGSEPEDRGEKRDSRTKDMVEVLEVWYRTPSGIRVVTLGDRTVELRPDRPNPFWHGQFPFVTFAAQPGLFKIGGMPQVEKIDHLQKALWFLLNQNMDNVQLLNNAIFIVNAAVEDPDSFEFEPGARWAVEGSPTESVQSWVPDYRVTEMSLPHQTRLETQMQNLAGSQPFTSTSEGSINAQTATEASLVTNLATRSLQAQRSQLYLAYQNIGQQRMELNQQFIRVPIMVEAVGLDSQQELVEIGPLLLQGDYLFDIEPMNESLFRQERRAEAQGMLQTAAGLVPVMSALAQAGAATPLNMDEFVKDWLKSYDVEDPTRFFSAKPQPAMPTQPQQPGDPGAPQGPGGVTAPQAIDPAFSPSNQSSISPEVFMQRAGAMSGGASNLERP